MFHNYQFALVRQIPSSFQNCVTLEVPSKPIDIAKAKHQHEEYIQTLKKVLGTSNVIEISADEQHPDCCFIEGGTMLINYLGHPTRRGEITGVREAGLLLKQKGVLQHIVDMQSPATLDGGDVLVMPTEIFVGLSTRTNQQGVDALAQAFPSHKVHAIKVEEGLHFKSVLSALDEHTIVVTYNAHGKSLVNGIKQVASVSYEIVWVPDAAASNLVRVKDAVLVQAGLPDSIYILQKEIVNRNLVMYITDTSELEKADGLLTCCSVLI